MSTGSGPGNVEVHLSLQQRNECREGTHKCWISLVRQSVLLSVCIILTFVDNNQQRQVEAALDNGEQLPADQSGCD